MRKEHSDVLNEILTQKQVSVELRKNLNILAGKFTQNYINK